MFRKQYRQCIAKFNAIDEYGYHTVSNEYRFTKPSAPGKRPASVARCNTSFWNEQRMSPYGAPSPQRRRTISHPVLNNESPLQSSDSQRYGLSFNHLPHEKTICNYRAVMVRKRNTSYLCASPSTQKFPHHL